MSNLLLVFPIFKAKLCASKCKSIIIANIERKALYFELVVVMMRYVTKYWWNCVKNSTRDSLKVPESTIFLSTRVFVQRW